MLNIFLEKNHEEMFELHFKHELMENQLVRKKHSLGTATAISNRLKLILGSDDPNYRVS